jgi:hypothetical protein
MLHETLLVPEIELRRKPKNGGNLRTGWQTMVEKDWKMVYWQSGFNIPPELIIKRFSMDVN